MNKPLSALLAVLFVTSSMASTACAEKPASAGSKSDADMKPAPEGPAYPADALPPVDATLAAYEQARVLFVADKAEGIADAAKAMAESATKAAASAPDAAKAHLTAIADAATALVKATEEGIEPARKVYGDVSKHVVALLVAFPSLTKGRFVFECPMSPGYEKWVQTDDKLANPYMGQRMPACGGAADWKV